MTDILEQAKQVLEAREKGTPVPLRTEAMGSEGYNLYAHLDGCSYKSHYDRLGFRGEIGRINGGRNWKQLRGNAEYIQMAWNHAPDIARAYLAECEAHKRTRERLAEAVGLLCGIRDECICRTRSDAESRYGCPRCREARDFIGRIERKGDEQSEMARRD